MCSNQAGRILRRVIPPSHLSEDKSLWLLVPKSFDPMMDDDDDDDDDDDGSGATVAVESHETPLGACLLSPKSTAVVGWGIRRKVQYAGRQHREIPVPVSATLPAPSSSDNMSSESKAVVVAAEPTVAEAVGRKRLRSAPERKKRKKKGGRIPQKKPRSNRQVGEKKSQQESRSSGPRVERWSSERYAAAETKLVEIMRGIGADVASPVARQAVREEARKHIGDTGLLDHLLKHMVGKVVADGSERLRRRHNAEGAMEYWLEPAELAEIRRKAGVADSFWVPPPGWKLGDATAPCQCGEDCEKESIKLREEVAAVKRNYESLLQWKNKVEEEMANMSSCLQGLKEDMLLMGEEKYKKPKSPGACHSSILHTA